MEVCAGIDTCAVEAVLAACKDLWASVKHLGSAMFCTRSMLLCVLDKHSKDWIYSVFLSLGTGPDITIPSLHQCNFIDFNGSNM